MANKSIWPGMLIIALVFGMIVVGCKDDPTTSTTNSPLNGRWISEDGYELKLNNGDFEASTNDIKMMKGTYTTSENSITMQITHVHSDMVLTVTDIIALPIPIPIPLLPEWYTKTMLKFLLKEGLGAYLELMGGDAVVDLLIDPLFEKETGTYSVSGNTLTMTMYNRKTTYTRG